MIVPGTTIAVSLLPGYLEVRDKGVVQKKIKIKNRSFDEVLSDLQTYFDQRGKRLAPATLRDALVRIGLPQVRVIITETQEAVPTPPKEVVQGVVEAVAAAPERIEPAIVSAMEQTTPEIKETVVVEPKPRGEPLVGDDFQDIEKALSAVEKLSDSFMAPQTKSQPPAPQKIGVKLKGSDEVIASAKTHAVARMSPHLPENAAQDEGAERIRISATSSSGPTTAEPTVSLPFPKGTEETVPTKRSERASRAPAHIVKPLVRAKALILGEDTVGKHSVMAKAGLVSSESRPYVFERVFELEEHRVHLDVWCFDDAVKAKVSRKEFYGNANVAVIVYASSDRWSFESLDFWLKEMSLALAAMPPVVIVANKKDLRAVDAEREQEPVSTEEGFAFAEQLAGKLGSEGKLHPVAFIETCSLTSEGVEDAFKTASDLFIRHGLANQG